MWSGGRHLGPVAPADLGSCPPAVLHNKLPRFTQGTPESYGGERAVVCGGLWDGRLGG